MIHAPARPIWEPSLPTRPAPLRDDRSVDFAIIGGGFAGLSTALATVDRAPGARVAILEAEHVGFGASGRGLGMVSPIHPRLMFGEIIRQHGAQTARWFAAYLLDEARRWESDIATGGIACELRSCPALVVARNERELRLQERVEANLRAAGVPLRRLLEAELGAWCGFPAAGAFVVEAGVSVVDPYALARGLAAGLTRRGVAIHEGTRAQAIRPNGGCVEIVTQTGARVQAGQVVIATNGYTSKLKLGHRNSGLTAAHTYLLATDPLHPEAIERLGLGLRGIVVDMRVRFNYARLHRERLLFGGSTRMRSSADDGADRNADAHRLLQREMVRRFPFLESVPVASAWGGPIHLRSLAQLPLIRQAVGMPHVTLNLGYNQGGILLALASGRVASALALQSGADADAVRVRHLYDDTRLGAADLARLLPWMYRS